MAQQQCLLLACDALLSEDETAFAAPLAEADAQLLRLLAPVSLNPRDSGNAVLEVERGYEVGVTELERAGHRAEGLSLFAFMFRLIALEKRGKS